MARKKTTTEPAEAPAAEPLQFANSEADWVRDELERRFSGGGCCMARARDFARFFPGIQQECVEEALHRLWKERIVEMDCLADGSFVFYFPLR